MDIGNDGQASSPRRLLAKMDAVLLIKTLQQNLASISRLPSKTPEELDEKVISLVKAIDIAMDASIPKAKFCPKSIPGFDENCKDAQMRARRLKKVWKKEGTEDSWEQFRLARAEKGRVIAKAKKKAYRESRAEACSSPEELWKAVKQAKNRAPRQPCLPNIQKSTGGLATEPREKIEELKKVLLPAPHSADLSDIQGFEYPNGLEMPKITQHEIFQTVKRLRTRKAPGPDQIPNEVLKATAHEICSYLEQIFNDSLILGHYLLHFKKSIIVILHKHGGNQDYTSPKSYRLISLLSILGKIMKAILATRISYMAMTHNLFSKTHFGG